MSKTTIRFERRWFGHPDRRLDASAPLALAEGERLINVSHIDTGVMVLTIETPVLEDATADHQTSMR